MGVTNSDVIDTVTRMEQKLSKVDSDDIKTLFRLYLELAPQFETDLGDSMRDVAIAKASALMLIQAAAHARGTL